MQLPFSRDEFFAVFQAYNNAVWPAQMLLVVLAIIATVLALRPNRFSSLAVSAVLSFLWAWLAIAYHLLFFSRINPLAYGFSAVSLTGALIFLWQGVIHRQLQFSWPGGSRGIMGLSLITYALIVYPLWSWLAGHTYPDMPTFGLPCPTTIFTIGLLAFLNRPHPRSSFVVPILWCFIGVQAAFLLGVYQDLGLIVAGVIGILLMVDVRRAEGNAVS